MNCLIKFIVCNLAVFFLAGNVLADLQQNKVAILPFFLQGENFKTDDMGDIVSEWLITAFVKDRRFEVVERKLLREILEEHQMIEAGVVSQESATEVGKLLGVHVIISGSMMKIGDVIEVNARIVDVGSASIITAESVKTNDINTLQDEVVLMAEKILRNFPLEGYTIQRDHNVVVIDLGDAVGVKEGMIFRSYKEGEAIRHPKTKDIVYIEKIQTGTFRIFEVQGNISKGTIIEETPHAVEVGNLVKSIKKFSEHTFILTEPDTLLERIERLFSDSSQSQINVQRDTLANGGFGPPLIQIKTGSFKMGGTRYTEKPVHPVKISRPIFFMTNEVTFEEYDRYCEATGQEKPDDNGWGRGDRPVINVSWEDAKKYAKWLSAETGAYYRLPFETEWEWAARSDQKSKYTWGDKFKRDMANCKECGSRYKSIMTFPIKNFPPNLFGIYDMLGNVWEWVEDCWEEDYYNAPSGQSARKIRGKCANRTIRGGGWNSPRTQTTVSARSGVWKDTKSNFIGFRLVTDLEKNIDTIEATPEMENKNLQDKNNKEKKDDTFEDEPVLKKGDSWEEEDDMDMMTF